MMSQKKGKSMVTKKQIVCILLLVCLCGIASADYTFELIQVDVLYPTTVTLFQLSIPFANNLTADYYTFTGKNATNVGYGMHTNTNTSGSCTGIAMKDYDTGDYVFDMDVSFTATLPSDYNSDYTIDYTITNLQSGNLTGTQKRFVNAQTKGTELCDPSIRVGYGTYMRSDTGELVRSTDFNTNILSVGWSGYRIMDMYSHGIPPIGAFDFTGSPTAGPAPMPVGFTATTGYDEYKWNYGDGTIEDGNTSNPIHYYNNDGVYTVLLDAWHGGTHYSKTRADYITVTNATGIKLFLGIINPTVSGSPYITGASVGIQNKSSGVWRNGTSSTGYILYEDTGASHEYPLSVGQEVRVAASATGFEPNFTDITLPYDGYYTTLPLIPTGIYAPGFWGLTLNAKDKCSQPIEGATCELITGVSGAALAQGTDSNGQAFWFNISPSTSASVTCVAQRFKNAYATITVYPNTTQTVNLQMVYRDGDTAYTCVYPTATVTTTKTIVVGGTAVPGSGGSSVYPTITDAYGNVITTSEGKGTAALDLIVNSAHTIISIGIGIVTLWLLWMIVYWMTGGDILTKMMRRR